MSEPNPARVLAVRVIERVRKGKRFSGDELERALRGAGLGREDRSLATTLVYGTLRHQGTLDWLLKKVADLEPERVHPRSLDILRIGAYQLLYLDRVPAFAAVNDAVEQVRTSGGKRAAGFANAVLRALGRALAAGAAPTGSPRRDLPRGNGSCAVFAQDLLPDPTSDPVLHLSVALSLPTWLVARWTTRFGRERTEALGRAGLSPPPVTLRVNRLRTTREELMAKLGECEAGTDAWSVRLKSAGGVAGLAGYEEGLWSVQDEVSMKAAPLLAPRAGGRYVDLCAAPGGKATHLAELMGDAGLVIALDPQRARVAKVAEACARLGLRCVRPVCGDGKRPPLEVARKWDGVLLDAPCSNTGVLARRVEARWRLKPADVTALAAIQLELLVSAAALVGPGGRIAYSTCSIEPEENEERVGFFVQGMGGSFRLVSSETVWPAPGASGGYFAVVERVAHT